LIQDTTYYSEETLFKVRRALQKMGMTEVEIIDCINAMQNEGILFREVKPSDNIHIHWGWKD